VIPCCVKGIVCVFVCFFAKKPTLRQHKSTHDDDAVNERTLQNKQTNTQTKHRENIKGIYHSKTSVVKQKNQQENKKK
jgi:hypothetical protein